MNRFGFIDSSGIIKTDQFFGVGFLISKNIGILNDLLVKNYQTALNITKHNKGVAIERLLSQGKEGEIINMLRKNKRFEMKFDYVRHSLFSSYKKMIEIFFSDSQNRFSVIVVNKYDPTFNVSYIHDTWEAYIQYASSLIIREMTNLKENNLCLIIDEISRPKQKTHCIEDAILSKIYRKIQYINREKNLNLDYNKIFGILSIESHSNVFMHLTDVLLGAVMYDFKKREGLISSKIRNKKEAIVSEIRLRLNIGTLANDFTKHSPAYFSVFEAKWKQKQNTP